MDALPSNPALGTWALCTAILALKMGLSAFYTSVCRARNKGYVNPEDATTFGGAGAIAAEQEHPAVAHALRIQRNDVENIPAFFAVGLAYVLTGASPFGAAVYLWTYTVARVLHTLAYMGRLQPWRALLYIVGVLCMFGMIAQVVKQTL
jgi:prostaglandin-E synthase 1